MQIILSYDTLALSIACFGSFSWAIVRLFAASAHASSWMKVLGITGFIFSIAQIVMIELAPPQFWARWSALVLYVIALGLFWWAVPQASQAQLNIAFTNTAPVKLLIDGPYAHIRHPLYASHLLYWMAGAFISNWLWVSVFVMGCFYFAAISQEENGFRLSPLAVSYEAYRRQAGALFPRCTSQNGNSVPSLLGARRTRNAPPDCFDRVGERENYDLRESSGFFG